MMYVITDHFLYCEPEHRRGEYRRNVQQESLVPVAILGNNGA